MRAFVSDLTLRIPLDGHSTIETRGRLLPVQTSKSFGRGEGSYKLCTAEGVPVKRVYVDPSDNSIVPDDELKRYIQGSKSDRANPEPEVKRILTDEEYAKVLEEKVSALPKNLVNLTVHPAEADDQLWTRGDRSSYIFVPHEEDDHLVDAANIMRAMLEAGFVLVSVANVRNSENFYRLILWRGYITLEPVVYTDSIHPHETIPVPNDSHLVETAIGVAQAVCKPFDAQEYVDATAERVRAIEASAAGEATADVVVEKQQRKRSVLDSMTAFLDSVTS